MALSLSTSFFRDGLPPGLPTKTERLVLVAATQSLANAANDDQAQFSAMMSAKVPETWPPEFVNAPSTGDESVWENCYLLKVDPDGGQSMLVGIAGIREWSSGKTIQVGAAIVPEYHGQGLGEEIVAALGNWALTRSGIDTVVCDVPEFHVPSAKSLRRAGYTMATHAPSPGFNRFELKAR
jgi:RimJ/RimL family protein N-acetyltransferase